MPTINCGFKDSCQLARHNLTIAGTIGLAPNYQPGAGPKLTAGAQRDSVK